MTKGDIGYAATCEVFHVADVVVQRQTILYGKEYGLLACLAVCLYVLWGTCLGNITAVPGKNLFNLVEDIVGILLGVLLKSLGQIGSHSDSRLSSVSHLVQVNEYAWVATVKTNVLWEEHRCVTMGVEGDNL